MTLLYELRRRKKKYGLASACIGGGQLGRMLGLAARRLGYRVHTLAPDHDTPTGQIADEEINASYDDLDAWVRETWLPGRLGADGAAAQALVFAPCDFPGVPDSEVKRKVTSRFLGTKSLARKESGLRTTPRNCTASPGW